MDQDIVVIVRSCGYDEMPQALRKGIEAANVFSSLEKKRIVIKPNLCSTKSSLCGATTDVGVVREVIAILNEKTCASCEIFVVESDAEGVNADYAFDFLGYRKLEQEFGNVKLVNLSKDAKVRITCERGKVLDLLDVPKTLLGMEYFISVAKLKTHVDQRVSCILKNQFGLLSGRHKAIFHPFLSEVICDLNRLYSPDLCIVDGIVGMEGFGPTDGRPVGSNLILLGTNPIATDIVASKIMGFKPTQSPHLHLAMKVNRYNESNFRVMGEEIRNVQLNFQFIPYRLYLLARIGLRLQKWGSYTSNLGGFLQKMRSALAIVGLNTASKKVSLKDMISIAKRMTFKISG